MENLNPGIKNAVLLLQKLEFETCDSGDGTNYKNGMEGAMPFSHIIIQSQKESLISDCDRLAKVLENRGITQLTIEGSYDPFDQSVLILLMDYDNSGEFNKLV